MKHINQHNELNLPFKAGFQTVFGTETALCLSPWAEHCREKRQGWAPLLILLGIPAFSNVYHGFLLDDCQSWSFCTLLCWSWGKRQFQGVLLETPMPCKLCSEVPQGAPFNLTIIWIMKEIMDWVISRMLMTLRSISCFDQTQQSLCVFPFSGWTQLRAGWEPINLDKY